MEVNKEYRVQYNFLLNCARQSSETATRLRGKVEELQSDIKTLDEVEEYLLEKTKKLKTMDNFEKVYSSGIKLEDAPSENRIRIFFNGKPDSSTIAELKRHAFRWTPSLGCWQAYRNSRSMEFAKNTANKEVSK